MNENRQTCKSFDRGASFELSVLPPLLARLLEGHQVYTHLGEADLREMSKFDELPNLEGLAAHPIRYPAPAGLDLGLKPSAGHHGQGPLALSSEPLLPGGVRKALAHQLAGIPSLVIRGMLAGASVSPFAVQVIVPQTHAHLAAALRRMLWPLAEPALPEQTQPGVQYTLFLWPEPVAKKTGEVVVDEFVAHWPNWTEARPGAEGLGVVIGFDDPRLVERMLLDAARRYWESLDVRSRFVPAGEGSLTVEGQSLHDFPEPLVVEEGEWVSPVWRNPLVPAEWLARDPAGREAALALGTLPVGVRVDEEGRFPLFHGLVDGQGEAEATADQGCLVVPREVLLAPFLREARRCRIA